MAMQIRIESEVGPIEFCDWSDFAAANADAFDADEMAEMASDLMAGREVRFGGGAAPEFVVCAESA